MSRFLFAAWTLPIMTLGGCAAGTASEPLELIVRDSTSDEPLGGARVVADMPSHDHPFSIATLLGQTGPVSSESLTDGNGRATVRYEAGRPIRIIVLARGYAPFIHLFDEPWSGTRDFEGQSGSQTDERRMRVRVEPSASADAPSATSSRQP